MFVYVDESGDPGLKIAQGSSSYFVVALVVFQDEDEARVLEQRLVLLRHELDLDPRFEFKFNKCSAEIRTAFLKAVAPYDFFYYGISIRKQGLYGEGFKVKDPFYESIWLSEREFPSPLGRGQGEGFGFDGKRLSLIRPFGAPFPKRRRNTLFSVEHFRTLNRLLSTNT